MPLIKLCKFDTKQLPLMHTIAQIRLILAGLTPTVCGKHELSWCTDQS